MSTLEVKHDEFSIKITYIENEKNEITSLKEELRILGQLHNTNPSGLIELSKMVNNDDLIGEFNQWFYSL